MPVNKLGGSLGRSRVKNTASEPTQADQDRTAQQDREKGAIAALKEAIALFDEDYGKGLEAKARASASSQAIKSGLGGTTRPGAVSAGLSAEFEDMRKGKLAAALANLSSFLGGYRDPFAVTPQVKLGQQSLAQQGSAQAGQLGFNYAQLGQQNKQFEANLGLGYAELNSRNNQPAPSVGDSIWPTLGGSGGDSSFSYPSHDVPIQWGSSPTQNPSVSDGNDWFNWEDPLQF